MTQEGLEERIELTELVLERLADRFSDRNKALARLDSISYSLMNCGYGEATVQNHINAMANIAVSYGALQSDALRIMDEVYYEAVETPGSILNENRTHPRSISGRFETYLENLNSKCVQPQTKYLENMLKEELIVREPFKGSPSDKAQVLTPRQRSVMYRQSNKDI